MRSRIDPELVKRVQRDAHDQLLATQMLGLLITRAGLSAELVELPDYAKAVGEEMARKIMRSPRRFEEKRSAAAAKYSLGLQ
jgi:hypothetical protein